MCFHAMGTSTNKAMGQKWLAGLPFLLLGWLGMPGLCHMGCFKGATVDIGPPFLQ